MDINLNKRYRDAELERMPILDAYNLICNGKYYSKFHSTFWLNRAKARQDAISLTQHVFSSISKTKLDDLPRSVTEQTFKRLKLDSMLRDIFNGRISDALMSAFPNQFNLLQFDEAEPKDFSDEKCAEAVRWLVEHKLHMTVDEAYRELTVSAFSRYHLIVMLVRNYKSDVTRALNCAYPNNKHSKGLFKQIKSIFS